MFYHMKTKSFTLIELLVVIVIIGILAGVITLSVSSNISKAQDLKVSSTILSVSKTLKADSYDSFPIETVACNLKNSCTTLKSRIDLPNITEDIYYKTSSSGKFFVIYANKPSNTSLGYEITSIDEKVKEVPSFDNLVAYYPLASGTANGTAISDMSPNSNNGTNYGASSAIGADGNIGTAMSFNGTNDYILVGMNFSSNYITESFWINKNTLSGLHRIIKNGNLECGISASSFFVHTTTSSGANYNTPIGSMGIVTNTWNNIVVTRNTTNNIVNVYLNGVLKLSGDIVNSGTMNLIDRNIGNTSESFDGNISNVRIYNRALSQEEITLLYNAK